MVSPVGTCRIHTPLRKGAARLPVKLSNARNYGFVHTSAEALQQLRFMFGQQSIPADVQTLVCRPGVSLDAYAKPHVAADLYIVELSSRKLLTVDGYPIQCNYMGRHFSDFFADRARSRKFWAMANIDMMAERRAWLEEEPVFKRLSPGDQNLLARILRRDQPDDEIERELREIAVLVGPERVVFVTHVDATTPDNVLIESRHRLIESVRASAQRIGVPCYDPTALMLEFGQVNALENGGLDLTHFTDAFAESLVSDWYRSFIAPRVFSKGIREDIGRATSRDVPVDDAHSIATAWEAGQLCTASKRVRAVLRASHGSADHRALLARMQWALGDYEGAIGLLDTERQDSGPNERLDLLLMRCHFELGQFEPARKLATAMLADEIETEELLRVSAVSATKLGDRHMALANWKRLFRVSQDGAEAATAVLDLLDASADREGAEEWAREVLIKLPSHDASFAWLWNRATGMNDHTGLMRLAEAPVSLSSAATLELARSAAARGFAVPAAMLSSAQRLSRSDDPEAVDWIARQAEQWLREGNAALHADGLPAAASRIQAGWLLDPMSDDAIRARRALERRMLLDARSAFVAGDHATVIALSNLALDTRTSFPYLDGLRGRTADALGDTHAALEHLRRAARAADAPVSIRMLLARVAVRAERYFEAIEALSQIAADPQADQTARDDAVSQITMLKGRSIRAARDMLARNEYEAAWALLDLVGEAGSVSTEIAPEKKRVIAALRARLRALDLSGNEERVAVAATILRLVPDDAVGLKAAASACMRLHRFADALPHWRALREQSEDVEQIDANIQKCLLWIDRAERHASASAHVAVAV
ncbi:tetratricopeptide repeat family protein 1 [Caballeronia insecticola]|uniref:Tetratricopeptide repeat family protein 1 n=1 Tax=Caballeronia insecticola TaxID=758793 RepID=R4WV09_9BURK|nr:tetratricopeptide repeat family protein 1 [Caballeronia insecticola]